MTPELKLFYKEMLAITSGEHLDPDQDLWFSRSKGLCAVLRRWSDFKGHDTRLLSLEQSYLLINDGLSMALPFNSDSKDYKKESAHFSVYLNPARLAWIRRHAQ